MNQLADRSSRGWLTRVFRRFAAPAAQIPKLDQSASQRARVDTSGWASGAPIRFGLLTTCAVAGAGFLGAVLASALPLAAQVAVAVGAACVGFIAPVGVLFAIEWLTASPRQRNEARDELSQLTKPADVAELSRKFSEWVAAKRAGLPVRRGRRRPRMSPAIKPLNRPLGQNHAPEGSDVDRPSGQNYLICRTFVMGTAGLEPATSRV